MSDNKNLSNNLQNFIAKAMEKKIYGSIEIFFEEGSITQVTQRIINKIHHPKKNTNGIRQNEPAANLPT